MPLINKAIVKEYAWSGFITFITAFLIAVAPQVGSASIDQAAVFGILLAGLRAGVSAIINLIATKLQTISSRPQ